jgi:CBS domain-containing protein
MNGVAFSCRLAPLRGPAISGFSPFAEGSAMATVADILAVRGTHVLSTGPEATVLDAALRMNEHKVGSLLVMDESRLIGIITERDMLKRVLVSRRDPADMRVADVMTSELICCYPHTTLDEARGVFKNRRIRHLPVLGPDDQLIGMISIGDLNAYQSTDQERTICILEQYIYGRA